MGVDVPSRRLVGGVRPLLRIDGDDDALRSVFGRSFLDQFWPRHRCGVKANLVCPRIKQAAHVVHRAQTTAHCERDKDLGSHRLDDVEDDVAPVRCGRDIQEREFVRALFVVAPSDFYRVSGIAQSDEIHTFDDPASGHVEARNDAFGQHAVADYVAAAKTSARACAWAKSSAPV